MYGKEAGMLTEDENNQYRFTYLEQYDGTPISVTMPVRQRSYKFSNFPPFFEGLLPEGVQLEMLLQSKNIDEMDLFSQLMAVGDDMAGAITIREVQDE